MNFKKKHYFKRLLFSEAHNLDKNNFQKSMTYLCNLSSLFLMSLTAGSLLLALLMTSEAALCTALYASVRFSKSSTSALLSSIWSLQANVKY